MTDHLDENGLREEAKMKIDNLLGLGPAEIATADKKVVKNLAKKVANLHATIKSGFQRGTATENAHNKLFGFAGDKLRSFAQQSSDLTAKQTDMARDLIKEYREKLAKTPVDILQKILENRPND